MKKLFYIASAFALMLSLSSFTNSFDVAKEKKEKAKTEKVKTEKADKEKKEKKAKKAVRGPKAPKEEYAKEADIWAFGFSASFKDSALYMTEMQEIHQVRIQSKTLFLEHRDEYSQQLKDYLEEQRGLKDRTCVMFFETTKKKAEQKYQQIRNRYIQETHLDLRMLNATDFLFKKIEDEVENE